MTEPWRRVESWDALLPESWRSRCSSAFGFESVFVLLNLV